MAQMSNEQKAFYQKLSMSEKLVFNSLEEGDKELSMTWAKINPGQSLSVFKEKRGQQKERMAQKSLTTPRMERLPDGILTTAATPDERNAAVREFQKI
jgi:hypothetical protein